MDTNMSDFQKAFVRSRLARLPSEAPLILDEAEEETSNSFAAAHRDDDSSSASSASSAGTIVPSPGRNLFARSRGPSARQASNSLSWTDFYVQELFLEHAVDALHITHHAYITPPNGSGPLFVMHHGAGSSGLSFASCAKGIRTRLPEAGILSIDARYHGGTTIDSISHEASEPELDLRLETLSSDLVFIVTETKLAMHWDMLPDLVLVGHSLGGAVITDVAKRGDLGSKLLAYAVLDVVEGSTMDALQSMETYLSTRPARFASLSSGIEWHTRSRTIRNTASARVSVPSLLKEENDSSDPSRPWVWRTNLANTKHFWEGWFVGLSKKFLEAKGGKLLLLAGTDRLDKELMIGQMQGKYQLQVLPDSGHFIHEDQPSKTAQILVDFYRRNDRNALILPPKVGDMMASRAMEKGIGVEGRVGSTNPFKKPFS